MKRSGFGPRTRPLSRGRKGLKRGGKIRSNAKRRRKNWLRAYGGEDRLAWLHTQPCVVSGVRGNIEATHVRNGGMSRKADAKWTVPMAGGLHRELHQIGTASFEAKYLVDLERLAEETERRWQQVVAVNAP